MKTAVFANRALLVLALMSFEAVVHAAPADAAGTETTATAAEAPAAVTEAPEADAVEPVPPAELPQYTALFEVTLVPSQRTAQVTLTLGDHGGAIKWLRFQIDPVRYTEFHGEGEVKIGDAFVEWRPPAVGGSLDYLVHVDHLRNERSYDARIARRWAVFRGEDVVPTVRIRTEPLMRSRSRLRLRLPEGWLAALPYTRTVGGDYLIDDPRRRFDRPQGWFVLGDIGALRENIAGVNVTIAGPTRHGLRRHDMLAFLNWTLPVLAGIFGDLPPHLSVVGAGDPMWRGGLSGPRSVFVHADRPLISEDGTSPLLHELLHAVMRAAAGPGGDWIVEGIAELYSVEALYRAGALSEERYRRALESFEERAAAGGKLRVRKATGATLAKAVVVLRELDTLLREMTSGAGSLDDVAKLLAADPRTVTTSRFREFAEQVAGGSLEDFFAGHGILVVPPVRAVEDAAAAEPTPAAS